MTSHLTFSDYAARLRDFISRHSPADAPVAPDPEFDELALSLFALQFEHNANYRRFCEARAVNPQAVRHWSQIPAIPAAAFKELELTSLPPGQLPRVFHSSGTTEQRPARHFHDSESLSLYDASLLPWFRSHLMPEMADSAFSLSLGERAGERASLPFLAPLLGVGQGEDFGRVHFISLTAPPELAPHSSLVHMFATIHREFGSPKSSFTGRIQTDCSWDLNLDQTQANLRSAVARHQPVIVMGTAFNFVQLLDHLDQTNSRLRLPAVSRVLETGGYKGRSRSLPKPELHSLITAMLGVPSTHIISEYGMCELSSQSYDWVVQRLPHSGSEVQSPPRAFHFPPWARAQIVSPETGLEVAEGETGLIRVFDLANLRSVLAVQTEDLGLRRGGGFELLGRATFAETRGCSLMSA